MKKDEYDELELESEDNEEDGVLISYDIATYPSDFTLSGIYEMWENKDIAIPDFQREFVWTIKQSTSLIESFLLGLPVPPVFFYIDDENKNLVIDGQQRILSIVFYFSGYFGSENIQEKRQVFRLQGLDERSPYFKKRFSDLDETEQRKLKNCVLRAINVRQLSPSDENTSIYHIFERLNTGGTPLKPQEIRNCVFRGGFVSVLRELNKDKNWRLILGRKHMDKHQKDVELILRLFALNKRWNEYEKPMKEFLNRVMHKNKKGNSLRAINFKDSFPEVCKTIVNKLGDRPFHVRGPLNVSLMDSVFCTVSENIHHIPNNLKERYDNLLNDKTFEELTSKGTTDTKKVKSRFELVKSYLIG